MMSPSSKPRFLLQSIIQRPGSTTEALPPPIAPKATNPPKSPFSKLKEWHDLGMLRSLDWCPESTPLNGKWHGELSARVPGRLHDTFHSAMGKGRSKKDAKADAADKLLPMIRVAKGLPRIEVEEPKSELDRFYQSLSKFDLARLSHGGYIVVEVGEDSLLVTAESIAGYETGQRKDEASMSDVRSISSPDETFISEPTSEMADFSSPDTLTSQSGTESGSEMGGKGKGGKAERDEEEGVIDL